MARFTGMKARLRASMKNRPSRWHYTQRRFPNHSSLTVECDGDRICTIVTSSPSVIREWLFEMRRRHIHRVRRSELVVGVGVQWTPPPKYVRGHQNPPATIQLCIGTHCLIVQLSHAPRVPLSLRRFLADPNVTFVGFHNNQDNRLLEHYSKHGLSIPKLIDLVDVGHELRRYAKVMSLERMAELELQMDGVRKDPDVGRSDWDGDDLTDEQVEYACVDAYVSFQLGMSLDVAAWNANRYASESQGGYDTDQVSGDY